MSSELHLPDDIHDLWQAFAELPPDQRRQFLQVFHAGAQLLRSELRVCQKRQVRVDGHAVGGDRRVPSGRVPGSKVFPAGRTNDLGVIDWNEDGKPDLLLGTPANKPGTVYLNRSEPGKLNFAAPSQPFELPFLFWGPTIKPLDWNGDGDEDFLVYSEFFAFYVERSFLKHGARAATALGALEQRQN
jgi:hypothetical protein